MNCNAKFDDKKGAEAEDWKNGKPVRVIRSSRLGKYSKYAPEDGFRYDGLYKVVKYYPEKGKSGFIVWRYLFRRDDPAPAPWEKNAKQYDMIVSCTSFSCLLIRLGYSIRMGGWRLNKKRKRWRVHQKKDRNESPV